MNLPTIVQQATGTGTGTSFTVTLSQAAAVGNLLVICIGNDSGFTSGVSGGGVTWVAGPQSGSHVPAEIWYGPNSTGVGTTITITLTNPSTNASANVSEWKNMVTSSPLDKSSGVTGISTTPTVTPITPTGINYLVISASCSEEIKTLPTNNFISLTSATANTLNTVGSYNIISSGLALSTGWTMSPSDGWDAVIASFKSIPGGGFENKIRTISVGNGMGRSEVAN